MGVPQGHFISFSGEKTYGRTRGAESFERNTLPNCVFPAPQGHFIGISSEKTYGHYAGRNLVQEKVVCVPTFGAFLLTNLLINLWPFYLLFRLGLVSR